MVAALEVWRGRSPRERDPARDPKVGVGGGVGKSAEWHCNATNYQEGSAQFQEMAAPQGVWIGQKFGILCNDLSKESRQHWGIEPAQKTLVGATTQVPHREKGGSILPQPWLLGAGSGEGHEGSPECLAACPWDALSLSGPYLLT